MLEERRGRKKQAEDPEVGVSTFTPKKVHLPQRKGSCTLCGRFYVSIGFLRVGRHGQCTE